VQVQVGSMSLFFGRCFREMLFLANVVQKVPGRRMQRCFSHAMGREIEDGWWKRNLIKMIKAKEPKA
jgi:hypothetical protein